MERFSARIETRLHRYALLGAEFPGLQLGFPESRLPTSLTRSPDGWNVPSRFVGHVAAKNPALTRQPTFIRSFRDRRRFLDAPLLTRPSTEPR
jgi:hypothetical protein